MVGFLSSRFRYFFFFGNNPITILGAGLTTAGGVLLVAFWLYEMLAHHQINPYTGIFFFLILPGIFIAGLALMPLGIILRRRKLKKAGEIPATLPDVSLRDPMLQKAGLLFLGLTFLNVAIVGTSSYKGMEYMDTQSFCGEACHGVMTPEYTAYQDSPHSRVACVRCHIGPGASWFVKAKVDGLRQVVAVTLNNYERPVPSPVLTLVPARETCEQCHWPHKFTGDRFIVKKKFADDEKNTPMTTVLVMKIGGKSWKGLQGIHGRHLDVKSRITYVSTDKKRQSIAKVIYVDDAGKTVEYVDPNAAKPEPGFTPETRSMDCIDCHNRPSHAFQLPERAVDKAMAEGRISLEIPFIRKKAVEILKTENDDRPGGEERIATALRDYYQKTYPDFARTKSAELQQAIREIQTIYSHNVFPFMRVRWGTHPNNLGHEDFPGCFRCHGGNHATKDGLTISQDCDACHTILAQDEADPKILAELGLK
ncbi:MAG: NapC/NirT family cytochrome c [Thermoanaerobaculia bacterium]|nr:hypothetical protein [Thermoanaerobaculia bacterium]MCK6682595.1 NapC/NirT family cytochrome c [Thermoanaerobaculia bacterium]